MTRYLLQWLTLSFILVSGSYSNTNAQQAEPVTFQVFYDALSPYGKWISDPANKYVWVPEVEKGFRPYFTNGSWKMTPNGATWVSNYSWGWAPFHYGRWLFDSMYGWVWIPGMDWSPSWVVWRTNGDDYGWTPLIPGFSISQSFSNDYLVPADWWVYVPKKWLLNNAFQNYANFDPKKNAEMLSRTHVINNSSVSGNTTVICGPRPDEFSRAISSPVKVYTIKQAHTPGKALIQGEDLVIYSPGIKKWENGQEPKPAQSRQAVHPIGKAWALSSRNFSSPSASRPAVKKKLPAKTGSAKKAKSKSK